MPESEQLEGKPLKKKKSVMGRIKSKISNTLGRKKSSHMIDTSPTDKDIKAPGTAAGVGDSRGAQHEVAQSIEPESASPRDKYDSENPQQDESSGNREVSAHEAVAFDADIVPFDAKLVDDDYEDDDDDNADGGTSATGVVSEENEPPAPVSAELRHAELGDDDNDGEEVFASDYQSPDDTNALNGVVVAAEDTYSDDAPAEDEDDDDEEKLEVFEEGRGNQHSSRESLLEEEPQQREQEPEIPSGPGDMNLVIVGLSPLKLSRSLASPPSPPVKKQAASPAQDRHVKPATPSPASPLKSPTLAHLHHSDAKEVDEPIKPKRRGGIKIDLLPAMPSPKKKTMAMTRLAAASSRETAIEGGSSELIQEAQEGAQEDGKCSERPPSPRSSSISRRRSSSMMEAPILASAAFSVAEEPASHDSERHEPSDASGGGEANDEAEDEESNGAGDVADFAFDAGAAITQEFGERVARLLGADPWGDRQDGFDAIQYIVKKADLAGAKNRRELFCAALAAVQGGVDDRVAPVMYCALECLRAVLKEFAPVLDRSFVKYPPTNEQLSALVKSMTLKLGDSNKRTQRETSQALLRVAKLKRLRPLPYILLHLSAKEVAPRIQVDALRQLVSSLGVDSKNGLSLGVVMQFAVPALKIADEKTRRAAVELIADLHMLNGQAVNAQLAGVKPEMLRVINRRVDELIAQREKEKTQAQNANQAEEAARATAEGGGGNPEDDLEKGAELAAVPADESRKTKALIEAQLLQAASVVGPVAWRKLESKTWSDRKEALVDMEKAMTEAKSDLRDAKPAFGSVIQLNFLAYCVTVHKCLGDSIAPVVNSAMDCLSTLIKVFGPCVEWREENVRDVVLLTIMRLFSTMQKPNSRTNRAACRSILKFARLTNAHTLRYTLSCIFAKETEALVQMHLLRLLIPEFGFQPDGISAALVLAAVGSALVHSNEKMRKTAIDVALCTQRLVGKEYVLKKLKDVKPVTLKELEKNFVDCEGKKDGERPQTVHASTAIGGGDSGLPPVNFGGGENARRLLNSAPVGVGKLCCTPSTGDDVRRGSVLSNEEENFMDSILDGGLDL
ncbi:hypothetical protein PybrP1_007277 [[Pythium] brassicae (nom. inval.)]|nr:hypothetical protein PybrP1_007277 [[Pythium] brassicae (nom. inval.)]